MTDPDAGGLSAPSTPWRDVLTGRFGRLTAGLVTTEVTVAVQVLLLGAALPAIARELHDLNLYGWVLGGGAVGALVATPLAGAAVDRWSAARLLQVSAVLAIGGMVLSALAPAMAVVVVGRFVVGCGTAAQYAVSLTSTVREVPPAARARIFAITGFAWIIPGLVGPSAGALLASTVGWRWALVAPVPLVIASRLLLGPVLRTSPASAAADRNRFPFLATALTAVGITALLSALAEPGPLSVPLGVAAVALSLWGLAQLLPAGTLRAARGLPAAIAVQFMLNLAYFAGDGFLPLALTSVMDRTLTQASLALTLSTLAWSAAGWWQARVAGRASPRLLITGGGVLIVVGAAGVIVGVLTGAWVVPYLTWTAAGLGMGIAYQTSWLLGSALATTGREGAAVSGLILAETLGSSLGAGLAGGALAGAGPAALRTGLLAAFAVVAAAAALTGLLGLRQPRRPVGASRPPVEAEPAPAPS